MGVYVTYRLVLLDGDETLWTCRGADYASLLHPPLRRHGVDTLEDARGATITLRPGARELLTGLQERDVLIALVTHNDEPPVISALDGWDLRDSFVRLSICWRPKGGSVRAMLRDLAKDGIEVRPEECLFIDDSSFNINDVSDTGAACLLMGGDINDLLEVLEAIDHAG